MLLDIAKTTARKAGRYVGYGKLTIDRAREIHALIPELIQRALVFSGFISYSVHLLRESGQNNKMPGIEKIKRRYRRLLPEKIADEFAIFALDFGNQTDTREMKKMTSVLRQRITMTNKLELIKILIYFIQADSIIEKGEYELVKGIAIDLGLEKETFESLFKQFASSASVVNKESLYNILGVDKSASAEEIHKAYRRMAAQCHPDRFTNKPSEDQQAAHDNFIEIARAYQKLKN